MLTITAVLLIGSWLTIAMVLYTLYNSALLSASAICFGVVFSILYMYEYIERVFDPYLVWLIIVVQFSCAVIGSFFIYKY